MWPFNQSDDANETDNADETSDKSIEDALSEATDEPETETVEVTRELEYTEHTATVEFADGTEREFTFDELAQSGGAYTLKNYTGAYEVSSAFGIPEQRVQSEAFASIPKRNVKVFETTERSEESIEYTVEVEREVDADE